MAHIRKESRFHLIRFFRFLPGIDQFLLCFFTLLYVQAKSVEDILFQIVCIAEFPPLITLSVKVTAYL